LRELRDTRAAQQLKQKNRFPAVGLFEEFLRFTQEPDEFRFGRQDDLFDDRGSSLMITASSIAVEW